MRLDIIYSKNKDKIFLILVTYFNTYYKTFEFNLNNIDKFTLSQMKLNKSGFMIKVLFNDGKEEENICFIPKAEEDKLKDLMTILNKEIIIKQ